jgi:exopolysaccharide biosynthesis polyprenyl glycosylphosphotransferase
MPTRPTPNPFEPSVISHFERSRASTSPDRFFAFGIAVVDALVILSSGLIVLYIRFAGELASQSSSFWSDPGYDHHLGVLLVFTVLTVLMSNTHGLYEVVQRRSAVDEAVCLVQSTAIAALLLTALLYFAKATQVSRLTVGCTAVLALLALLIWRLVKRNIVYRQMIRGYGCRNVLVYGAGQTGREFSQYLNRNPQLGYKVCGFLDDRKEQYGRSGVLGSVADFRAVAMEHFVDEIVITTAMSNEAIQEIVLMAQESGIGVKVVPAWMEGHGLTSRVQQWGEFPVISLHEHHFPAVSLALKRIIDIVFSISSLVLLAPIFLVVAVLIKCDSKGSIIYRSKRVGRRGREFDCYKFRTMVPDAEQRRTELERLNERNVIIFKIKHDPRVTRVGRWLRKYSIDELPQFWNVLKGDMSVVGPRPPIPSEVRHYELEHMKRIDMTPGITGLWQITARCNPSFHRYLQCDLEYTSNWSLKLDLMIMLKTVPVVLKGTGQ